MSPLLRYYSAWLAFLVVLIASFVCANLSPDSFRFAVLPVFLVQVAICAYASWLLRCPNVISDSMLDTGAHGSPGDFRAVCVPSVATTCYREAHRTETIDRVGPVKYNIALVSWP